MDSQIVNAIETAWNPSSAQQLQYQAFRFLDGLEHDKTAWQASTSLFTRHPRCSDVVRLVSLDIVINAIRRKRLDHQSLLQLKNILLDYTRQSYSYGNQDFIDPPHLQNKLTQLLTLLFATTYNHGWESFMDDFLSLTSFQNNGSGENIAGTILYLRILGSIHDEIADVLLPSQDTKRNTELKDALRARDVPKLAASWQKILQTWQSQNDTVVEMCLLIIGKWVSWIDASLIMNQNLLNILFQLVGRTNPNNKEDRVRDAAIGTFTEIVGKKMKTPDKISMIKFLNLGELISQLIASPPLNDMRQTSNYDTDLAETVAKLVNNIVCDIVKVLDDPQAPSEVKAEAKQLIQNFMPLLLRFLSDEYDEVCSTVISSLTDFFIFLRKEKPILGVYYHMLPPILNNVVQKMRYDEKSSWGDPDEDTDEAEFQELRKRLLVLQKSIAAIDESLYLDVISTQVTNTLQALDQHDGHMDWRDLELALQEIYVIGELALSNGSLYTKGQPTSEAAERLVLLMTKMLDSGVASFPHPANGLQYMEICVRYWYFFEIHAGYTKRVLEHFVRFVHHSHVRVRNRSWYLFHRFVKNLRNKIGDVAEMVIQSIGDLMTIITEVPKQANADDLSSETSNASTDTTFNSQLFLFEAIGSLSSDSSIPLEKQVLYIHTIMNPLFSEIERNLASAKSGDVQAILHIHHVIMALGTLAHGFSDWTPGNPSTAHNAPHKKISEEFSRAAEATLIALEALNTSIDIRTAARAAFSRLIGALGLGVLPLLPRWIKGLLSESSSRDEMAMFLRLLDQVIFGYKKDVYDYLDPLLSPLLQLIFTRLAEPVSGTDDEIQLAELRREYLTFVQIILNNNLGNVLVSNSNIGLFEQLILSITSLAGNVVAKGSGNLAASRLAFSVMTLMVQLWGGPDVENLGSLPNSPSPISQPAFPGFDRFLVERFHPICWEVLREPSFMPANDAQCKQVLNEIAGLEQAIYTKTGDRFLEHLQQQFFPALGIDGNGFLNSLTTSPNRKGLAKYLQTFLAQLR
ncbi:Exportin-T [Podosphaera aphanis]|nr:Exportin-T [Podosphaera aphanis]